MTMSRVDLKVVMLGHEAVGKTSLLERYVNERFNESAAYQNTIGSAFVAKQVEVDGKRLILGLWDTAGSERYNAMVRIYYRGAKAAIVCYQINDQKSFNRAKYWVQELRSQEEECKIYLCVTKKDLLQYGHEPTPELDIVERYASGIQSKLFVTSSKTGDNISELFEEIAKDYLSNPANIVQTREILNLSSERNEKSSCCAFLRNNS